MGAAFALSAYGRCVKRVAILAAVWFLVTALVLFVGYAVFVILIGLSWSTP
jgi:hypothetical protein